MAKEKPLLIMSASNPKGLPLETILECLIEEVGVKNDRLAIAIDNAGAEKLPVMGKMKNNNDAMLELLSGALNLQNETRNEFEKLGPDQGPKGKSRI